MARTPKGPKQVAALNHEANTRRNIATAELADLQQMLEAQAPQPPAAYPRARPLAQGEARERDGDLDPQIIWNGARITLTRDQVAQLSETGSIEIGDAQLVWRGKDRQDWSDLIVNAPPLYIQEKVHPKAIIDDLTRLSKAAKDAASDAPDLFADFNGLTDPMARTEFYQHDQHWSNRMILGDSLQVMASLAEREALKGKVQCIYFDPPYGIKFNSNWQVSTASRDVKDGKQTDVSREPEQVKAFRDTWKDGIHSYLTYLRDRLTVARELLTESGSIFVQIGDENVHRVRAVMDEVFGADNSLSIITLLKSTGVIAKADSLHGSVDYILHYARHRPAVKFRPLFKDKSASNAASFSKYRALDGQVLDEPVPGAARAKYDNLKKQGPGSKYDIIHEGVKYDAGRLWWGFAKETMPRLQRAGRIAGTGTNLYRVVLEGDYGVTKVSTLWDDVANTPELIYVVQTNTKVIERCLLLATDPGDLVLDPTCGSGTTTYVAEQWGRRWITIDTSRVALALARTRLMSARYPYYFLKDSAEGRRKEQAVSGRVQPDGATLSDLRQGFVYERTPHVTLKSIANNSEIDTIWETWATRLDQLRAQIGGIVSPSPLRGGGRGDGGGDTGISGRADAVAARAQDSPNGVETPPHPTLSPQGGEGFQEWQLPREAPPTWPAAAKALLARWWEGRIARQREIDASIAKAADVEMLYDRPYADPGRVRVAGPFTVESLSPHRVAPADQEELLDGVDAAEGRRARGPLASSETDFATMVLEHLKTAGVHQTDREGRIAFTALTPWPGQYVGAEGLYLEGDTERRAAIFIGPEFGTLSRTDLTAAAREASESRFDVLIACSFAFDAMASEITRLGPLPILKARMNPDLHMAGELKNTGKGNLFTVFGEPDIDIHDHADGRISVEVKGVDIYDPNTGEVRSNDVKGIAAWFIDTAYNEESFFVRHAYFLGANEPYKALKTALKAEIDEDAWATLNRATSRPFERPATGRIAVKVINHFGDEVMKVFGV